MKSLVAMTGRTIPSQGKHVPVEIGVCVAVPGTDDAGAWGYGKVKIPARTPKNAILDVALNKYLATHDDVHVHHAWIQCVGPEVEETAEEFPASESEHAT